MFERVNADPDLVARLGRQFLVDRPPEPGVSAVEPRRPAPRRPWRHHILIAVAPLGSLTIENGTPAVRDTAGWMFGYAEVRFNRLPLTRYQTTRRHMGIDDTNATITSQAM